MSPKLERDILPKKVIGARFVRQGDEVYFCTDKTHKEIVLKYGLLGETDKNGRPIVSDGGFFNCRERYGIKLFGETSSCATNRKERDAEREASVEMIEKITGIKTEQFSNYLDRRNQII